jgi:hypothetical protein
MGHARQSSRDRSGNTHCTVSMSGAKRDTNSGSLSAPCSRYWITAPRLFPAIAKAIPSATGSIGTVDSEAIHSAKLATNAASTQMPKYAPPKRKPQARPKPLIVKAGNRKHGKPEQQAEQRRRQSQQSKNAEVAAHDIGAARHRIAQRIHDCTPFDLPGDQFLYPKQRKQDQAETHAGHSDVQRNRRRLTWRKGRRQKSHTNQQGAKNHYGVHATASEAGPPRGKAELQHKKEARRSALLSLNESFRLLRSVQLASRHLPFRRCRQRQCMVEPR